MMLTRSRFTPAFLAALTTLSPSAVRAPNGLLVDALQYWEADTRYYDPAAISAPVLMVVGDWDVDTPAYMAQAILTRLGSRNKRLVIVGEGTHHLMLERNRLQMFREVQMFLNHEGHEEIEGHEEVGTKRERAKECLFHLLPSS